MKLLNQQLTKQKTSPVISKMYLGNILPYSSAAAKDVMHMHFLTSLNSLIFNRTISWFAGHVKKSFNYQTMDLAVTKDAQARLSRVPYSKHQLTGLAVVPFTVQDKYEAIIEKALAPEVKSFYREDFITDFHLHLQEIDKIEAHNAQIKENIRRNNKKQYGSNKIKFVDDHRVFFKSILGEPVKEYPEKEYVMYNCPFPDHDDKKPSLEFIDVAIIVMVV